MRIPDDFYELNGATMFVPGSFKEKYRPPPETAEEHPPGAEHLEAWTHARVVPMSHRSRLKAPPFQESPLIKPIEGSAGALPSSAAAHSASAAARSG